MKALQYLETSELHVQRHAVMSLQDQNLQQHRSEDPPISYIITHFIHTTGTRRGFLLDLLACVIRT